MGNSSTAQGRKRGADRIKIASFDDLFGNTREQDGIQEIPLGELHPFKNHPFKIIMDKEMDNLVESIRQHGKILVPGTARKHKEGGYELISGHRRREAAKLAGLSTMPVIIKEMTDDEAVLEMVEGIVCLATANRGNDNSPTGVPPYPLVNFAYSYTPKCGA